MEPNVLLESLIDEAGVSRAGLAGHVNQAGRARGLCLRYEHTAVARWLKGQRPRGQVPDLICEVLAGRLGRPVTLDDIGMGDLRRPRGGPERRAASPGSSSTRRPCGAPTNSSVRTSPPPPPSRARQP